MPEVPFGETVERRIDGEERERLTYNVGTADGLAEASFYSVMSLPTVLVEDAMENGIGEWRGDVPRMEEVLTAVRSA